MNKKCGYTLIELAIYIIILSIVSNIIVFSISNVEKTSLKNDAIKFKNIVYEMQTAAIFTNMEHGIRFINDNEFCTYNIKNSDNMNIKKNYKLSRKNFLLSTNAYENKINYTNRGTITKACEIVLASQNYKVRLTVDIGSGNLTIYEVVAR